jgi:NitT/TauT family transport system substrate-binding protein
MQMYAQEKYGPAQATRFDKFTVSMAHPDAVVALLSGSGISAHFSSPPFHQRERKDPRVRTILNSDDVMGGSTTFTMISTTSKFRLANPQIFAAVLKALEEANRRIMSDKTMAADLLVTSEGGGLTRDEIIEVLGDPRVKFTTTPENVMKYAAFMYGAGSLKNRPSSWKDLFFSEIHGAPGS